MASYTLTTGGDTLTGTAGGDTFSGKGGGLDSILGGAGDDLVEITSISSWTAGSVIHGGYGEDTLRGSGYFNNIELHGFEVLETHGGSFTLAQLNAFQQIVALPSTGPYPGDVWLSLYGAGGRLDLSHVQGDIALYGYWLTSGLDVTGPASGLNKYQGNTMGLSTFSDTLRGGAGDDQVDGSGGDDLLYGGRGNDTLIGGYGGTDHDTIYGGDGDDVLGIWGKNVTQGGFSGYQNNDLIYGGAGNDFLAIDGGPCTLYGGAGNDTFTSYGWGGGELYGGAGDDTLALDFGDLTIFNAIRGIETLQVFGSVFGTAKQLSSFDTITTSEDADYYPYYWPYFGIYVLRDGPVSDLSHVHLKSAEGTAQIWIGCADQASDTAGFNMILPSYGNLAAYGTKLDDVIQAGTQSATSTIRIDGDAGNDKLIGSLGTDSIQGGAGDDTLVGGAGDDLLDGGFVRPWWSAITEPDGHDLLNGGAGDDTLAGTTMYGGTGDDLFIVDEAGQVVREAFEEGDDTVTSKIDYRIGANVENLILDDQVAGQGLQGTGNILANRIVGSSGADTISGYAGDDTLNGGDGADVLIGGKGEDVFVIGHIGEGQADVVRDFMLGTDKIALDRAVMPISATSGPLDPRAFHVGAAAHDADDRIVYDRAHGLLLYDADGNRSGAAIVIADIGVGKAITAADVITLGKLAFAGTGAGDVIDGDTSANLILGYAGSDVISGDKGVLGHYGQFARDDIGGTDTIGGMGGDDTISGGAGDDRLGTIWINGQPSDEAGNDSIDGGYGRDTIGGGNGNDTLVGGERVAGGAGNDSITGSGSIWGGAGDDTIQGDGEIWGGAGDDKLQGIYGDDTIAGGFGNDTISGGGMLAGGAGDDSITGSNSVTMSGGMGSDTFSLRARGSNQTILDFDPLTDTLKIDADTGAIFRIGTAGGGYSGYVLYDPSTGALIYDRGLYSGNDPAPVVFGHIAKHLTLTSEDVVLT